MWDRDSGEQEKIFLGHLDRFKHNEVTSVAFRRQENQVLSASKDKTAELWQLP